MRERKGESGCQNNSRAMLCLIMEIIGLTDKQKDHRPAAPPTVRHTYSETKANNDLEMVQPNKRFSISELLRGCFDEYNRRAS